MARGKQRNKPPPKRTRNKDGTYRWCRDGEEGDHVINLFRMYSINNSQGADPENQESAYIRQIYQDNPYFSGPIDGANHRFHLKAFREAYKRLAREYISEGEERQHQGKYNIMTINHIHSRTITFILNYFNLSKCGAGNWRAQ